MNYDAVHKPEHYTAGRKFEPKDVIRDWDLNFNLGNAVKYLARAGRKDDIVQDLKKAQEYIQFEIDAIEAEIANKVAESEAKFPHHPNCKCSVKQDKQSGGVRCGVIEITVPADTPPEEVVKMAIKKIYGAEE